MRVDDAAEHADHGERATTLETWAVWATAPAAVRGPIQRFVDKVELKVRGHHVRRRKLIKVERSSWADGRHQLGQPSCSGTAAEQSRRCRGNRSTGIGKEQLALGEAQHRFESAGESEHIGNGGLQDQTGGVHGLLSYKIMVVGHVATLRSCDVATPRR